MNHRTPARLMKGAGLALCALLWGSTGDRALGQIVPGVVQLTDSITGARTLSADTIYQITGTVRVVAGGLLMIPPGTLIYGNGNGIRSCIQVERDGKIHAQGSADRPIVFTSPKAQHQRAPGDWGGIIILGRGKVNMPGGTAVINGTGGIYGGNDDADSSGVLTYVRIEYAGGEIAPATKMAGLTLAAIGNRTKLDHIQVSYCGKDSYEWFGGVANATHLTSFAPIDDDFQTGLGYQGRLQFIFGMRDSTKSDPGISNGLESENDAIASANTPLTRPIVSNATIAGPFRSDTQATGRFGSGGHLLRNSRYGLFNSVIVGWQEGLRLDGAGIAALPPGCPQPADLKLGNNSVGSQTVVWGVNGVALVDAVFWFICAANANPGNHPLVGLEAVTQSDLNAPDPRPVIGTPAATGTSFADPLLAAANNFTFTNVGYKGAFDPNVARDRLWDTTWSNYDPNGTTYVRYRSGWNLVGLANTPASAHKDSIFRGASNAFRFNNGYQIDNVLDVGAGYWINLVEGRIVEQKGAAMTLPVTITVQPGWNLISSGASIPAPTAGIIATGTSVQSSYFGFDNGYRAVTSIEPGRGYWVKVSTAGTLTLGP